MERLVEFDEREREQRDGLAATFAGDGVPGRVPVACSPVDYENWKRSVFERASNETDPAAILAYAVSTADPNRTAFDPINQALNALGFEAVAAVHRHLAETEPGRWAAMMETAHSIHAAMGLTAHASHRDETARWAASLPEGPRSSYRSALKAFREEAKAAMLERLEVFRPVKW